VVKALDTNGGGGPLPSNGCGTDSSPTLLASERTFALKARVCAVGATNASPCCCWAVTLGIASTCRARTESWWKMSRSMRMIGGKGSRDRREGLDPFIMASRILLNSRTCIVRSSPSLTSAHCGGLPGTQRDPRGQQARPCDPRQHTGTPGCGHRESSLQNSYSQSFGSSTVLRTHMLGRASKQEEPDGQHVLPSPQHVPPR